MLRAGLYANHDRSGLLKNTEINIFFRIKTDRVDQFREALASLIPLITSTGQITNDRDRIDQHKKEAGRHAAKLLKIGGVAIAFSKKGLSTVLHSI